MTQLLEMKDKIVKFTSKYERYLWIAVKFAVSLALFLIINLNVGYMDAIGSVPVSIILAIVCSLMPVNAIIFVAGVVVLLHMYALSVEAALTTLIVFVFIYFVYFRFAPKDGFAALLTPICFVFKVPYIMPISCGLLRPAYSVVSVVCGTIAYYFIDGIHQNATSLIDVDTTDATGTSTKFNVSFGQLMGNKEMFLVVAIFVLAAIVVYYVRRMSIENAWTIAIVAGTLIQFSGVLAGYLILNISGKTVWLIVGNIISLILAFVLEFFLMNLDYARTERVQFEDDEYYYYVKAVPKKMITTKEKTVKRFSNTAVMGKKIDRNTSSDLIQDEEISRRVIAEELDIDEELLK